MRGRGSLGWAALFTAMHVYWYLGGTIGLGDALNALPPLVPSSIAGWIFEIVVVLMFVAGLGAPMALLRGTPDGRRRRLLVALMWTGAVILVARGGSGLLDDAVRQLGLSDGGITGLTYEHLGNAHTIDVHPHLHRCRRCLLPPGRGLVRAGRPVPNAAQATVPGPTRGHAP